MAGPLSSSEIEDVVSSVRRLVSADERVRPVSRDLGPDKLLLTPALRVVSEPAAAVAPLILTVPLDEPSVKPEAAMADGGGPQLVEADWEDEIWQEEPLSLAELALGAEEAEVVDAAEAASAIVVPLVRSPDQGAAAGLGADVGAADPATAPAEEAGPGLDSVLPAAEPRPQPQPSIDEGDEGDEVPTLVDSDGNPLTVLDEDALYEIVRTLIREELQGALGERITRNVRKLVRAEINRALTARALD